MQFINKIKLIILLTFILITKYSYNQCFGVLENVIDFKFETYNKDNKTNNKICNKKNIRVNIHFMLKGDGTGNFTEIDDGLGGPLTGYQFANDLLTSVNLTQNNNFVLNLPPQNGENNPVDKNYFFILEDIFFHRDDYYYYYENLGLNNPYMVNSDSVINIFFTES